MICLAFLQKVLGEILLSDINYKQLLIEHAFENSMYRTVSEGMV